MRLRLLVCLQITTFDAASIILDKFDFVWCAYMAFAINMRKKVHINTRESEWAFDVLDGAASQCSDYSHLIKLFH